MADDVFVDDVLQPCLDCLRVLDVGIFHWVLGILGVELPQAHPGPLYDLSDAHRSTSAALYEHRNSMQPLGDRIVEAWGGGAATKFGNDYGGLLGQMDDVAQGFSQLADLIGNAAFEVDTTLYESAVALFMLVCLVYTAASTIIATGGLSLISVPGGQATFWSTVKELAGKLVAKLMGTKFAGALPNVTKYLAERELPALGDAGTSAMGRAGEGAAADALDAGTGDAGDLVADDLAGDAGDLVAGDLAGDDEAASTAGNLGRAKLPLKYIGDRLASRMAAREAADQAGEAFGKQGLRRIVGDAIERRSVGEAFGDNAARLIAKKVVYRRAYEQSLERLSGQGLGEVFKEVGQRAATKVVPAMARNAVGYVVMQEGTQLGIWALQAAEGLHPPLDLKQIFEGAVSALVTGAVAGPLEVLAGHNLVGSAVAMVGGTAVVDGAKQILGLKNVQWRSDLMGATAWGMMSGVHHDSVLGGRNVAETVERRFGGGGGGLPSVGAALREPMAGDLQEPELPAMPPDLPPGWTLAERSEAGPGSPEGASAGDSPGPEGRGVQLPPGWTLPEGNEAGVESPQAVAGDLSGPDGQGIPDHRRAWVIPAEGEAGSAPGTTAPDRAPATATEHQTVALPATEPPGGSAHRAGPRVVADDPATDSRPDGQQGATGGPRHAAPGDARTIGSPGGPRHALPEKSDETSGQPDAASGRPGGTGDPGSEPSGTVHGGQDGLSVDNSPAGNEPSHATADGHGAETEEAGILEVVAEEVTVPSLAAWQRERVRLALVEKDVDPLEGARIRRVLAGGRMFPGEDVDFWPSWRIRRVLAGLEVKSPLSWRVLRILAGRDLDPWANEQLQRVFAGEDVDGPVTASSDEPEASGESGGISPGSADPGRSPTKRRHLVGVWRDAPAPQADSIGDRLSVADPDGGGDTVAESSDLGDSRSAADGDSPGERNEPSDAGDEEPSDAPGPLVLKPFVLPGVSTVPVPPPLIVEHLPTDAHLLNEYVGENDPNNPNRHFFPSVVHYMTPEQREASRVFVDADGLLRHAFDGTLFDTSLGSMAMAGGEHRAAFVMDGCGNLYATLLTRRGRVHHSSLLAGGPVAGAGEIEVRQGRLVLMSDRSGHYGPGARMNDLVLQTLRSQGLVPDPDLRLYKWNNEER